MRISVIIPAHNEEKLIESTLDSLESQTSPPYEVIVVCNGCTDGTVEIVKRHPVKMLVTETLGVSHARNLGAKEVSGEVILFIDADVQLAPDFLYRLKRTIKGKDRFVGCSRVHPDDYTYLFYFFIVNLVNLVLLRSTSNGILFLPKKLFDASNGFPEGIKCSEDHLFIRKVQALGRVKYIYLWGTFALASTRRLKKVGVLKLNYFWWVKPHFMRDKHELDYEVIR